MLEIIKVFKEYFFKTIVDYFKNELILLKNILEVSKHIMFREEDLIKLISILVTDCDISRIRIDHEIPNVSRPTDVARNYPSNARKHPSISTTRTTSKSIIILFMSRCRLNLISSFNKYSQINYILQKVKWIL
jgi:hypothetical protein